jgi:hypothetical protein
MAPFLVEKKWEINMSHLDADHSPWKAARRLGRLLLTRQQPEVGRKTPSRRKGFASLGIFGNLK